MVNTNTAAQDLDLNEALGAWRADSCRFAIAVSRFNQPITEVLLKGAVALLQRAGVKEDAIQIYWVPGAYELPLMLQRLGHTERYDGLLALGAVIRGETDHYNYVCSSVSHGIQQVSLGVRRPIGFGLLTVDTLQQAQDRADGKAGNKGAEAALATLEMMKTLEGLPVL